MQVKSFFIGERNDFKLFLDRLIMREADIRAWRSIGHNGLKAVIPS